MAAWTAWRFIFSESVGQCQFNAPQLVNFGQVLGKLNYLPVAPSPATNTQCKKKSYTFGICGPSPSMSDGACSNPPLGGLQGRHGS